MQYIISHRYENVTIIRYYFSYNIMRTSDKIVKYNYKTCYIRE